MGNTFLEKSFTKCGGETIPDPSLKNQNWTYLWINSVTFYSLFLLCAKLKAIKIYWNKALDHLHLFHIKLV